MMSQYLKTALRNIKRYSLISAINIAGLSIGIASAILILMWVYDEWSYDRHFTNADNLFRLTESQVMPDGNTSQFAVVPSALAASLKSEYPEVIRASRCFPTPLTLKKGDDFIEETVMTVGKDFLKMFNITFVEGDINTALDDPHNIIMTEEMAKKFFGNSDPLGQTIMSRGYEVKVTGVVKSLPTGTHFHFNYLVPVEWMRSSGAPLDEWRSLDVIYIELKEGTDSKAFEIKIRDFINRHQGRSDSELHLQNIKRIHLFSLRKYMYDSSEKGDITYVRIFSLIAGLILIMACINFMNLSIAHYVRRAKEVGIRKVSGADRQSIVNQFLIESFLTVLIAFVLGMIVVVMLLPAFNALSAKNLIIAHSSAGFYFGIICIIFFCCLLSGGYPAYYISSLNPVSSIMGIFLKDAGNERFRRYMVIFQFTVSLVLITFTLVVRKQVNYLEKKDLGFDRSDIGYFMYPIRPGAGELKALKYELKKNPDVLNVTIAHPDPFDNENKSGGYSWTGKNAASNIMFHTINADGDYASTFGIEVINGRFLSDDFPADEQSVVINETAAKILGFTNPVGESIVTGWGGRLKIIGIVRDFNFQNLHFKIEPLLIMKGNDNNLIVKMKHERNRPAVDYITRTFNTFKPGLPIDFHFLQDDFDKLYTAEKRTGTITGLFSLLAIMISCLGLLGLSSFMAENRTKELGIRKVNGARSLDIFSLLTKEYIALVTISFVIATPVAWIAGHCWLQTFAYRINENVWFFAFTGVLVLAVTMFTVGIQSYKAAFRNPVESLRYE